VNSLTLNGTIMI